MSRKRPLPGQKRNLLFKQPTKWEKTDGSTYSILTVLINQKSRYVFHCVLGAFSIGDRSQRIREACCRRQTGPGVAPCKRRCWEGVFSCGTEQNQEKKRPSIGWHPVINNDHKDGQSGALLQKVAPLRSRPPRRPQASITMPTDHRQELYPASDLHLILIMAHFLLFL